MPLKNQKSPHLNWLFHPLRSTHAQEQNLESIQVKSHIQLEQMLSKFSSMKFAIEEKHSVTTENKQKNGIIYLYFLNLMQILAEELKAELSKETI
jgi:hypothetical protein